MNQSNFVSRKEMYRVGDMVKYEYLDGEFSTAKVLELEDDSVTIKIGLPHSKKSDIYEDILKGVSYNKIMPFSSYVQIYENK